MTEQLIGILDQIQSDLAELQNNPDELTHEQLLLFYDRMCANVTDYETLVSNEINKAGL